MYMDSLYVGSGNSIFDGEFSFKIIKNVKLYRNFFSWMRFYGYALIIEEIRVFKYRRELTYE